MSLARYNLIDLLTRYNNGERGVCNYLFSKKVQDNYNDLQLLTYLFRYASYNETIEEMFNRCIDAIEKGKVYMGFDREQLFNLLFYQRITFSGHRLLNYGKGDTEACVTASFNSLPIALSNMLAWMKDLRGSGFELLDVNMKNVFAPLEILASSYQPFKENINTTMEYRFNLVVNIANYQVIELLDELLPMSRTTPASNHATIAILDSFLNAVKDNTDWKMYKLKDRIGTSKEYEAIEDTPVLSINARTLMNKITRAILSVGKPSIIFLDAMNDPSRLPFFNMKDRKITSTNLCCEISLPTKVNELATCNIAAVNVSDIESFEEAKERARVLVHCLNSTITHSTFPYTVDFRPLGVGTLGSMTNYSKFKSLKLLDDIYFGVYMGCLQASVERAIEDGNFKDFIEIDYREYPRLVKLAEKAKEHNVLDIFEASFKHRYNLTLTAQPPTASMATFCNTSPSLEPCEHKINLRSNNCLLRVDTPDCGLSFPQKISLSEKMIKMCSLYTDQTISASAFIHEPKDLARLIFQRRSYVDTGMYYARTLLSNETVLCKHCSI